MPPRIRWDVPDEWVLAERRRQHLAVLANALGITIEELQRLGAADAAARAQRAAQRQSLVKYLDETIAAGRRRRPRPPIETLETPVTRKGGRTIMRRISVWLLLAILGAARAAAQTPVIINPPAGTLTFNSPDHTGTVPAGQANAGQPLIASYQAMVFLAAADVTTATPIVVGPVVPKTAAAVVSPATTPPSYVLTFPQLGIGTVGSAANQIPPCTVVAPATCPVYDVVMVAIGPGGTSARAVAAESNPFTLAPLQATQTPAGPDHLVAK